MHAGEVLDYFQAERARRSADLWRTGAWSVGRVEEVHVERQEGRPATDAVLDHVRHLARFVLEHLGRGYHLEAHTP